MAIGLNYLKKKRFSGTNNCEAERGDEKEELIGNCFPNSRLNGHLFFFNIFLAETKQINSRKIASICFLKKEGNSIVKMRLRVNKQAKSTTLIYRP
jgi:hypothetical protein